MTSPQKPPDLHITQNDLIEQLKGEIEHLRKEVAELRDDKKSLRADKEHLKQTNLRLEIERAEMLKALLDQRRENEAKNLPTQTQAENPQQQQRMEAFVEWLKSYESVGRLVPVTNDHSGEYPNDCADEAIYHEEARASSVPSWSISVVEKAPAHEETNRVLHALNPDAHGYFQGQTDAPSATGTSSFPHPVHRKKTPTHPRALEPGPGCRQNPPPQRSHRASHSNHDESLGQKRKLKKTSAERERKPRKKKKKIAEPAAPIPVHWPVTGQASFDSCSSTSWNGHMSQRSSHSVEPRGRTHHRNFDAGDGSYTNVRGHNHSSDGRNSRGGFAQRSQSQIFGSQDNGWQGMASQSHPVADWEGGEHFPNQHKRFT